MFAPTGGLAVTGGGNASAAQAATTAPSVKTAFTAPTTAH
jgi:hypothetical protein